MTDEFVQPIVMVGADNEPIGKIKEGDVIVFFNFRNDRAKEITIALTQKDMPEYDMKTIPLYYCTMTPYDATFTGMNVIFEKDNVTNTMGEVIANAGLSQLRIAETEKYAHVTFFFSGGREKVYKNEERIMVPSPKVATYDLMPEMNAYGVRDRTLRHFILENSTLFVSILRMVTWLDIRAFMKPSRRRFRQWMNVLGML